MSERIEPAVLYAEHKLPSGEVVSVALFRTRWSTEGQAVVERTAVDGTMDFVEPTAWFLRPSDTGPATLHIDRSARMDEELADNDLGLLLDQLVSKGGNWGIEAREAL